MKTTLNCLLAVFAVAILTACGKSGDTQVESAVQPDQEVVAESIVVEVDEPVSSPRPLTGEQLFIACQGCHTLQEGAPDLLGPNLYGFMDQAAATRPGYNYSASLKGAGLIWNRSMLTAWIVAAESIVPGTTMAYDNIITPNELAVLVDYLVEETGGAY